MISLAIFAFGALTFSTLALFYWSERLGGKRGKPSALPVFTLVCAVAFLINLASRITAFESAGGGLATALLAVRSLAVGLLPPLILHLTLEAGSSTRPVVAGWRWLLAGFYAVAVALAIARVLQDMGLLSTPWSDLLYRAPAASLAAAAGLGLLFQAASRRSSRVSERTQSRWMSVLLALMLVCSSGSLLGAGAYLSQFPDYLLLAFFCISLYYRERLVFFDVLMKRGVFLALGLTVAAAAVAWAMRWPALLPAAAIPWLGGFAMLFWLAGPAAYAFSVRVIDRVWLRRPYSAIEAERQFIRDVQGAAAEDDLLRLASDSLSAIFQAPAQVVFGPAPDPGGYDSEGALSADVEGAGVRQGFILLAPRPNGVPFLSDDRRLLHLLAGSLGMVLENVRFRAERRLQAEREQQLRLLASRAELKALRAQINPHFFFNALSAIAGLIQSQPDLADETIERLAQVFRYALRNSEQEWAPLGGEVEFIAAYLGIEQARFGDRLRVEIEVEPAAKRILIPAMSVQPLIENAVKHGISGREGSGIVRLRAALADGALSIEVFDNGPGFPPGFSLDDRGESRGLRNVADRLRGYYGDAARLSWENRASETLVALTLPESVAVGLAV
jgi:hypothetical protein